MTANLAAQAHFGDYTPTNFGWSRKVPDLVPLSYGGVSFGSCAREAHPVFMALLAELVPHIDGGLHAGSCGAYSTTDDLPDGSWSFHRYGIAIDINWNVNKMGTPKPASGRHAIPHAVASQIARKYGCEYGGDWTTPKDWMHFECHLTPQVARTVTATATKVPAKTATPAAKTAPAAGGHAENIVVKLDDDDYAAIAKAVWEYQLTRGDTKAPAATWLTAANRWIFALTKRKRP